jgi:hypothetical protein
MGPLTLFWHVIKLSWSLPVVINNGLFGASSATASFSYLLSLPLKTPASRFLKLRYSLAKGDDGSVSVLISQPPVVFPCISCAGGSCHLRTPSHEHLLLILPRCALCSDGARLGSHDPVRSPHPSFEDRPVAREGFFHRSSRVLDM